LGNVPWISVATISTESILKSTCVRALLIDISTSSVASESRRSISRRARAGTITSTRSATSSVRASL